VEKLAKKKDFPDFRFVKKFKAETSQGSLSNKKVIIAKPQTFMNDSGQAVKKLIKFMKLKVRDLLVVHDDIDLPLGKIKISKSRGSAGHKGVQSIINNLKTKDFIRFRIGIKPKNDKKESRNTAERFVLQKFNKKEEEIIKESIRISNEAIEMAVNQGIEKAMGEYNQK
jgi:PTH1 family peptidyl-tRNA hydrolase